MAYEKSIITRDEIRELRELRDWSRRDLADACYVHERSVDRWESGVAAVRPAMATRLRGMLDAARKAKEKSA